MKCNIYIFILFISIILDVNAQKQKDSLEIWTYSIGNFVNLNAEKIIERKFPFKIKAVSGDVLSEESIESIEKHNSKVWNYIDSLGYNNIKEEYNLELKAEINRIKKAIEISKSNKRITKLYLKLKDQNLGNFIKLSKKDNNIYNFKVYSFDLNKIENNENLILDFSIDIKKNKIYIIK
ncbi:hypothetical protein EQG68_02395 [Flavobacterium piscinae]|uniref:Uncharacterized protein n=1 Tax=Flavobacterium piscinae TaxID=2506424 RepID=A0A4Q1KYZ6_9FLAO|nr:hypothetical protein [Flavobacterium piscinae]RXR34779.1 hypothetical protein EQG68_02395 [Flavobacterium piscinae]